VSDLRETLASEFAAVEVSVDRHGNGPRLRLEDLRTGHEGFLDPLELETLAWLPDGALHPLLDPSALRWREQPGEAAIDQLVRSVYAALAAGDRGRLGELLAEDFEAELPQGMPLGAGGRRRGADEMIDRTWWVLGRAFEVAVHASTWIPCAGGRLLVLGRYRGRARAGGAQLDAALAHLWSARGGRITHLWHLSDTAAWNAALQPAP
jgi:ketosteroid isomerase-like protein